MGLAQATNVTIDSVVPMMGGQLTPLHLLDFVVPSCGDDNAC